jgi:probable HAF family extracellular repeat protein
VAATIAAVLAIAAPFAAHASAANVVDLGTLGGSYSVARAVNGSGQVVGQAQTSGGQYHAFSWTQGDGMVDLGTLGGGSSVASAVNDSGQVVGGGEHAFSWTQGGGIVDLGTLGGSNSGASAVNGLGEVVGTAATIGDPPLNGQAHAFSWTQGGGMVDLGTLGGSNSGARAVNDSGQVVGEAEISGGQYHAFSWTQGGGMVDLGTLGGSYSTAIAVNGSGQVVGNAETSGGQFRAFSWTQTGGIVDLGSLGGGYSTAIAVNGSGQVVGNAVTSGVQFRAFSWTQTGGMVDLGTLGGPSGASAVNGSGQVVGEAETSDGHRHAFSWTQGGGMVDLGTLGGSYSTAIAVNGSGQVVGAAETGSDIHAVLWQSGGPPTVTSVAPTTGSEAGGTSVTITGANLTGATAVDFGATRAPAFTVNSDSSITATAPAGTGTVNVTVTTPGGTSATTSADQFTYAFDSISPTFGEQFGSGPVEPIARVHPIGGSGDVGNETATISWGDGAITNASLTAPDPSTIVVRGTHTYWTAGRLHVTVKLVDAQRSTTEEFHGDAVVQSRYAGMGDSYSSGEGAGWPAGQVHPDLPGCDWQLYQGSTDHINGAHEQFLAPFSSNACYTADAPHPLKGNTCHRAKTAYAHVVARLLAIEGMTLDFVACSGAVLQDAYSSASSVHHDRLHTGERLQVGSLGRDVSLITLTFGGNNIGFPGIVTTCAKGTLPPPAGTGPNDTASCINQDNGILNVLGYDTAPGSSNDGKFMPKDYAAIQRQDATGLSLTSLRKTTDQLVQNDLHDALVLMYRELKAKAPGARILVLGYPTFFPPGGVGSDCEHFTSLDQPWANERAALVNQIIDEATLESGVAEYVDVSSAFDSHWLCTGSPNFVVDPSTFQVAPCTGSYINGVDVLAAALGSVEDFHPNPCAHQKEGEEAASTFNAPSADNTFALRTGESHTTTISLSPVAGLDRINVTTTWNHGALKLVLTDPSGGTHGPVQRGPDYATWDIPHPAGGMWTLTETYASSGDLGVVDISVTNINTEIPARPLPPAGQIKVARAGSCHIVGCDVVFRAVVNKKATSRVDSYTWFDDHGNKLTQTSTSPGGVQNDMVQDDSLINRYRVILRTNGPSEEHRYTVACSNGTSVTAC